MSNSILERLLSVRSKAVVCWLGNAGWLIYSDGRLVAIDLDLESEDRIKESPIPTRELAGALKVNFITHEHGDHFNDKTSKILAEKSDCTFVLPSNCVQKALDIGIKDKRIHVAHPGKAFELPGLHVQPMRAFHGHLNFSVYKEANMEDCGYLLTLGGLRFLHPGDTLLLHEQLELEDIDVLFVSPTEHNTHIYNSAAMINAIEPRYIFPQHFGTYLQNDRNFYWTQGYPRELKAVLSKQMQQRFHILEQGELYYID